MEGSERQQEHSRPQPSRTRTLVREERGLGAWATVARAIRLDNGAKGALRALLAGILGPDRGGTSRRRTAIRSLVRIGEGSGCRNIRRGDHVVGGHSVFRMRNK